MTIDPTLAILFLLAAVLLIIVWELGRIARYQWHDMKRKRHAGVEDSE